MAKKITQEQANQVRDELGLENKAVPVNRRDPAPRAAAGPSATAIQAQKVAAASGPDHSLWEEAQAAFRVDNTVGRFMSKDEQDFPIDLQYDSEAFLKENMERINALGPGADHDEIADEIGSAWSSDHANSRLLQMERDFDDEMMLMAGGGSALALRLGAALLDPVDLAIALATAGTVGGAVKAGRFGKILTTSLSAGAAAGGTEALLSSDNVMRDETDVAFAAIAGITLGGMLGSLGKAGNAEVHKLANEGAEGVLDGAAARTSLDAVGAQRRTIESMKPNEPLFKNADEALDAMETPEFRFKGMNNMLFNLQSRLFYHDSPKVRKAASAIFEGGFHKDKDKARLLTVENKAVMDDAVFQRNMYADSMSDFKAWTKRNNFGSFRREMTTGVGEKFYTEVGLAMRGITDDISPEAISAAGKITKHMDEVYDKAAAATVKGFDKGGIPDYFPRVLNRNKFSEVQVKVGDDALAEFFFGAMRKVNDDVPDSMLHKISRMYVRTMREKVAGIENDLLHGIRLDDVERLRARFADEPEIEELISEIEHMKRSEMGDRGSVSFGKRRIQFDESHSDVLKNTKTNQSMDLKFTDMYENDARLVLTRYSRAMHGHIAMADKLGVRSRGDFERLTKEMASEVESLGGDASKMEQDFRDGFDLMLGQPIDRWNPNGDAAQASRMVSGWNYGGRGGQFGVNAMAELGNTLSMGGLKDAFRIFPDMKRVMERGANGELELPLARTLELNSAPGVNTLITPAVRNLDELAEGFGGKSMIQKFAAKMDPFIKSLGRTTSITSMLGPITDATQRVSALRHVERLARFANGKKISKGQQSRIRAAGITAPMQERIFKMLRAEDNQLDNLDPKVSRFIEDTRKNRKPDTNMQAKKDGVQTIKVRNKWKGGPDAKEVNLEIMRNPTHRSLMRWAGRDTEHVRIATDNNGNLFVWDAEKALHDDLLEAGLDIGNHGGIGRDGGHPPKDLFAMFERELNKAVELGDTGKGGFIGIPDVAFKHIESGRTMVNQGGAGKYRKGRLVDIDMDKWTDKEALAAFNESNNRVTREAIQMPDISTSSFLFNHPAGRLIFQFMRFPMDAVNKQLARQIHHADGESVAATLGSFAIASTVYMAQQSIEYANNPEELKKRLQPAQIAKIGFMRTGYSSMLPGVMDSAIWAAGFDPQFSMGRSSGLSTVFPIAQNATTTLLKNAGTFAGGITRSALQDDIQFSQADMRAGLQVLPMYRALGLKNAWHAIEQQFPESRKQE